MRRAVVALLAAGLAGCFDFDAAYQRYCDGGRCGGGVDAGDVDAGVVASDGGDDGGVPDGGEVDAGPVVDAGCQAVLCPVDVFQSARTSMENLYPVIAPGIVADSLDRFVVWSSEWNPGTSAEAYQLVEYDRRAQRFAVTDRTTEFDVNSEARVAKGSVADRWLVSLRQIHHVVDGGVVERVSTCAGQDAGSTSWYGLEVLSPSEVLMLGFPFTICRWTEDAGLVPLAEPSDGTWNVYVYDAHRTASGSEYVVGGRFSSNMQSGDKADGRIYFSDGGAASAPATLDTRIQYGWTEIDGIGDDAWVVSGSGAIAQLRTDGGFEAVFDAEFALRSVSVGGPRDVWAVGDDSQRAVHFDGERWAFVQLPSSAALSNITWERVKVTPDGVGLVLSGFARTGSPPTLKAVVHSYRRFGK
jgi:hypothetical protein